MNDEGPEHWADGRSTRHGGLVSVIVPVFNTAEYLADCVGSLLTQTYADLEILLIDDGSTDSSPALCDEYARTDSRVTATHQDNAGLSEARNTGLRRATGAQVMFLDSDDWLARDCIEVLRAVQERCGARMALCGTARVTCPADEPLEAAVTSQPTCLSGDEFLRAAGRFDPVHPVSAWAKLIDADLLDGFAFPTGRLHEDVFTTHRLFHAAQTVAVTRDVHHFYRQRTDSLTAGRMSLASAADKSRAHLERATDLYEYGLGDIGRLEFNRGLGWHLRVSSAAPRHGRSPALASELSEQRTLIGRLRGRASDGKPLHRLGLAGFSLAPECSSRCYGALLRARGAGSHPIEGQG